MGMHIPEAGQESFAGRVDDPDRGWPQGVARSNLANAAAIDEDVLIGNDFPGFSVEYIGMGEQNSVWLAMGEFGGEIGGASLLDFTLRGKQSLERGFPPFRNRIAPLVHCGEEFVGSFQPEICGRKIQSSGGVEGDVLLFPASF